MYSASFHLSRTAYVFLGIIAGVFIGTTIKFALGWNAPESAPPKQDEIFVPINTGSVLQVKNGDLGLTGNLAVGGGVKVGVVTVSCEASIAGTMRYNTNGNVMEYCNGSVWSGFGSSAVSGVGFDPGAKWQKFNTQRTFGVWYTNDTQYAIEVQVTAYGLGTCSSQILVREQGDTGSGQQASLNYTNSATTDGSDMCLSNAIVLPGREYMAKAVTTATWLWYELRTP